MLLGSATFATNAQLSIQIGDSRRAVVQPAHTHTQTHSVNLPVFHKRERIVSCWVALDLRSWISAFFCPRPRPDANCREYKQNLLQILPRISIGSGSISRLTSRAAAAPGSHDAGTCSWAHPWVQAACVRGQQWTGRSPQASAILCGGAAARLPQAGVSAARAVGSVLRPAAALPDCLFPLV